MGSPRWFRGCLKMVSSACSGQFPGVGDADAASPSAPVADAGGLIGTAGGHRFSLNQSKRLYLFVLKWFLPKIDTRFT